MKKIFSICVMAALLIACESIDVRGSSSAPQDPTPSGLLTKGSSYKLVWQDEFNTGSVPDTTKWNYDIGSKLLGGSVWGNNEREYYTNDAKNAYIKDGKLIIQVKNEIHPQAPSGKGIIATSARMRNDTNSFYAAMGNLPYGFYEIRAKLHCIKGSWPALWLLGRNGDWPARGEIDILEWKGSENNQTASISALHTTATQRGTVKDNVSTITLPDMCTAFHVFQLHWLEDKIVTGIDGKVNLRFDKQSHFGADEWPFNQTAFLIFNVAVGGNLGGSVDTADLEKMKLEIDYVRVWKK